MKKKNDELIIKVVILALVVMVLVGAVAVVKKAVKSGDEMTENVPATDVLPNNKPEDYNAPASIQPKELPEDLEGTVGFSPKQLAMLTEHYALTKYEIGQDSVIYYYQTALATNGERFMVICTKMSQEDYLSSIPDKNVKNETYKDIELTYSERWLYSVPNDFEITEPVQKGIDEGTMEIEYGNSLREVIKKDCFYWFDNGVKYEIQVRNQNLPYDTLYNIAKMIIDA